MRLWRWLLNQDVKRRSPVALAVLLLHGATMAQTAPTATSADALGSRNLFETSGQEGIGPRPFTSFAERLTTPVDKISIKVAADNLPADGVSGTDVSVQLVDGKGQVIREDVNVSIEVDGGARILLPGRLTSESGADRGDVDRIEPGVQVVVKNGQLQFKLIAPYRPDAVNLRVSVRGVVQRAVVRYVPDLREMIAVGLLEGRIRSDRFDPRKIAPAGDDDGFDTELRGFTKDFNGGKSQAGGRAALYLKGKIKGEYLLTLAYDSDKYPRNTLFKDVNPNDFYPVYGDSSVRGVDAQSNSKLYVRVDDKLSYLLWGDYTTQDTNPARQLSQYSRSLTGARGHYEEGRITANGFAAQQSYRQVIDEFPARGVSGPYAVSNPSGIKGSEKIEIIVRDRNRPSLVLKTTELTRTNDYEFEPFDGKILFRAPIPSFDDQLNPVSIRVTYEVEQGGASFWVYGADGALKLTDGATVGIAAVRDENPAAPYEVQGANARLKLGKNTELIAEVARTRSVVNTNANGFNTNNSNNFVGKSGELTGTAARVEIRHSDEDLRLRGYAIEASNDFNNATAGITGGKREAGVAGVYQVNKQVSINAEATRSDDRILDTRSDATALGIDLKLTDRLTIGGGVRHVNQDAVTLNGLTGNVCSNGATGSSTGFNNGFGISQQGNQQIDPATGLPVVCSPTSLSSTLPVAPTSLDRTSVFGRVGYKLTDTVNLLGELQRETGADNTTLYRVGADWQLDEKTRLYSRYEHARTFGGAYGLGVGDTANTFNVGVDTQYMKDGSLYSEYRLRDATNGRDVQTAVGLRNGWRVAEGLRLLTNVERLAATTGNATAAGLGLEYTGSELWKGSGRIEWREDPQNTNWLLTAGLARKIDRNWTLLARDFASRVLPRAGGAADRTQNRFQVGFAYRPVDTNKFDALGLYEHRIDNDRVALTDSTTHIANVRANYHPTRVWTLSGRAAFKRVNELLLGTVRDSYNAGLVGGRVTYDVTNRWSVGTLVSVLQGQNSARQYAYGLEMGYVVMDNLLVTLGYNWSGFRDGDLTGGDYTNRGWVFGMRYKFDEDLFKKNDPAVNKTLSPAVAPTQP